jgi:AsmA protein
MDPSRKMVKNIAFTGNMDCKEISKRDLKIANVTSPIKAENGVIKITSLSMDIFGAKAEGDASADGSEAEAVYKINLRVSKLDFEKLEESFGLKKVIGGMGDLHASLTMEGKGNRSLMNGMDGTFSLRGDNLVIYTMDLDKVLSSFETSQEFNLVDLGAFLIAGPLSTFAIKGYRFWDVYNQTRGGRSAIKQFISHWKIKGGVADATDCALATRHYRVALKGKLNLAGERYDNVIVALLDDKGCAKFQQSVSGSFASPRVGAVSSMESLAGPISKLYRRAKRFVQGGRCEVFYSGSVQQPPK